MATLKEMTTVISENINLVSDKTRATVKNYEKVYRFYTELFEATDEWVETCEKIGFKDWDLSIRGCRTTRFYLDWLEYDKCLGDLLQDKWDEMYDMIEIII